MDQRLLKFRQVGVAAALFVAGHAFAGTYLAEIGPGYGQGKDIRTRDDDTTNTLMFNAAFGYRWDSGFGVRALAIVNLDVARGIAASLPNTTLSFDHFVGAEATGYLPIAPAFNLMGGLGLGRSKLDDGANNSTRGNEHVTDGVVSAGLQWQPGPHYAMELHVDHLTTTSTNNIALMFQVPF